MPNPSDEAINETIDLVFNAAGIGLEQKKILIQGMKSYTADSLLGWTDVPLPQNVFKGVNDVRVLTLIIAGSEDIVNSPERLEKEVRSLIPGSKMFVIEGVRHLSML